MGAIAGAWICATDFWIPAGVVFGTAFLLFRFRLLGAGDGKLMALTAGFWGLEEGLWVIGAGLGIGAVWALYLLIHKRDMGARLTYLSAWIGRILLTGKITAYGEPSGDGGADTVPLAACLAAGNFLYLLCTRLAEMRCL